MAKRRRTADTINFLSMRHAITSSIAILLIVATLISPTCSFSPIYIKRNLVSSIINHECRVGGYCPHDMCLHASEEDDNDNSNESRDDKDNINDNVSSETNIDNDDEEDEVDIITQRLRRNAENSNVINPIKEVEKMKQENENEASNNSTGATLYSQMVAEVVGPDFDPSVSVEEEYVATQFKELLSRKGEQLSKFGPGIATLPLDPTSDEAKSEDELAKKETELQQVVEEVNASGEAKWNEFNLEETSNKQTEVLEKAHKLQTEIDQLFIDDCGAVLLANLAFYEAFSLQDAESMRDVWWQSPSVMCIHPSHPPLIGSTAVFQSFTTMFENDMKAGARVRDGGKKAGAGGVYMTPTNIRGLSVRGTTASLVCDEEIRNRGTAGESSSREGGLLVNKLLTTNIFRKINGQWKMTHRHASWHPTTAASQAAVEAEPGIVLYDEKKKDINSSSNSRRSKTIMTLKKLNGEGTSKRPKKLPSVPTSLEGLDTNAVLGVPKPKEEEKKNEPKSEEGMIGKIINLSDLLGGGGDSDKDEEDKGIADALSDMLMGSADSGSSSTTGSGTPEDPFITRKIIKIGPEGLDGLIGKNSKPSDDEEDKEVVIDLRDKSEEERKEVLSNLVDNVIKDAGLSSSDVDKSALDASTISSSKDSSEDLRQRTISTLRKLADDGLLSSKQKRILMTDIITSTASGTNSIVEVAYELLCIGEEDSEGHGIEDFTEQCHAFADSLDQ